MKYEKLLKHVTSEKIKKTSHWRGLRLNEETGAIFPASRWGEDDAKKEKRPYNEQCVSFYFMPGDICVLNHIPLATYDLVPYGMPGKFESRKSVKSEFTYIHELFDKYEAFLGMRVSMLDGKPFEARLLDDIQYNKEALKLFNERHVELRSAFFTLNRMDAKEPKRQSWKDQRSRLKIIENRRALLVKLLSKPLEQTKDWSKKIAPYYAEFWHAAYAKEKRYDKIFDNMIRFDKAHLFRELGVVK